MDSKKITAICFSVMGLALAAALYASEDVSLFWPPPPAPTRIIFMNAISSPKDIGVRPSFFSKIKNILAGATDEGMDRPTSVAVRDRVLYVCDTGGRAVHVFDGQAKHHTKITKVAGTALISPVGVAVSPAGDVFISDSELRKVFRLQKNGSASVIGGEELFLRPTGLAVTAERLYVVDTAAHGVMVFDLQGNRLSAFGSRGAGPGEFNYPTAITADAAGDLYVVDALNFRIQMFDKDGHYRRLIGEAGDASGYFSRPKGVAVDSYGHIYSTDGLQDAVQIFGPEGEFLLSFGESGTHDGQFCMVSGIAIAEDNTLFVADAYNQRVQVFRYVGSGD